MRPHDLRVGSVVKLKRAVGFYTVLCFMHDGYVECRRFTVGAGGVRIFKRLYKFIPASMVDASDTPEARALDATNGITP